jgi:hypothetical protein
MTTVTRWIFDYGGSYQYSFPRNPDRLGGDSGWIFDPKFNVLEVLGANVPTIQTDGFNGAHRTIKFTAITGTMMRVLQDFFLRKQIISNCRDHLYSTTPQFSCFITSLVTTIHPTMGTFPGSGEDTYDVEMTLLKMG